MTKIVRSVSLDLDIFLRAREARVNISQAAEDGIKASMQFQENKSNTIDLENEAKELRLKLIDIERKLKTKETKKVKEQQEILEKQRKSEKDEVEIEKVIQILKKMRTPEKYVDKQANALRTVGVDITSEKLLQILKEATI